jgi:Cell Wall Hydrolase
MAGIAGRARGRSRIVAILSLLALVGLVVGTIGFLLWSGREQSAQLPAGLDKLAPLPDAPKIPTDPLELAFGSDKPDWNLADFNVEGTANNSSTYENVSKEEARKFNERLPFVAEKGPPADPYFLRSDSDLDRSRAIHCLSLAVYYEANSETLRGQHAVAQVVLNRVRHPAWPHTVCGVVFQGSERSTGCQFTFTCDGALGRPPSNKAWRLAQSVAYSALSGYVNPDVGLATHYHTDWVAPRWAPSLKKLTQIGTHIFYTWKGRGGTPIAFRIRPSGTEAWPRKAAGTAPELGPADRVVEVAVDGTGTPVAGTAPSFGTQAGALPSMPQVGLPGGSIIGGVGTQAGSRTTPRQDAAGTQLPGGSANAASGPVLPRYELPKPGADGLMAEPDLATLKPRVEIPELVMPSSGQHGQTTGAPAQMVREQKKSRALDGF